MPPNEDTASTNRYAPCAATIRPISATGLMVPDGVSWWQTATTRISGRACSRAATLAGSMTSSKGTRISSSSAQYRLAQ